MHIKEKKIVKILIFLIFSISTVPVFSADFTKFKKYDPTLMVTIEEVLGKISKNKDVTIIDVRPQEAYAKQRIPGSMNMTLFSIKSKPFLKSKNIILVNDGYNYSFLEGESLKLRKAGFNAYILHGGLNYWMHKGSPLEGDIAARKSLNKVQPLAFLAEKNYSNWIIIDVSSYQDINNQLFKYRSIHVPYSDNEGRFLKDLDKSWNKVNTDTYSLIMICDEKGDSYDKIEAILAKTKFNLAFYLEGGKESLKKTMDGQFNNKDGKESKDQPPGHKNRTCK